MSTARPCPVEEWAPIERKTSRGQTRGRTISALSEPEKAYMAALIDGEGSVYTRRKQYRLKDGEVRHSPTLCVAIYNT